MDHVELEKYNTIVKGELTQTKQQLEKFSSSSGKIDEKMSIQRPTYDKTSLGYLLGQLAKKNIERKELDPKPLEVKEDLNKIESSQSIDMSKERECYSF